MRKVFIKKQERLNANKKRFARFSCYFTGFFMITTFVLAFIGCAKEKIVVEYKEVFKAVPQKCDLNISKPVIIDTSTLQRKLGTLTNLTYDGLELREKIKATPCLNVTEIERLKDE